MDRSAKRLIGLFTLVVCLINGCGAGEVASGRQLNDEVMLAESLETLWKLAPGEADGGSTYYVSFSERPSIKDPSPEILKRLSRSFSREVKPASEALITLDRGVVDRQSGKRGVLLYAYVDAVRPKRHVFVVAGLFDTGKSGQEWLLMFTRLNEKTWSIRKSCLLGVH